MATVLSYAVAAMLNLRTIGRSLHEPIRWGHWVVRPALATFVMAGVTFAMWAQWSRWRAFAASRMENGLFTVAACVLGATVYTVALLATGAVDSEALSSVPRIGPFLLRVFQKIGLVR